MSIARDIEDMTAAELLHTLAFLRHDYLPETAARLENLLKSKGYNDRQIKSWREQFLSIKTAETTCQECGKRLILEYEELVGGRFECPHCRSDQQIMYNALDRKPFDSKLIGRLTDASHTETSQDLKREITDKSLFKALTQGSEREFGKRWPHLKYIFVIRKFTNEDLITWRQKNIDNESAEIGCRNCGKASRPTREELQAGEYLCPFCEQVQVIDSAGAEDKKPQFEPKYPNHISRISLSLAEIDQYSDAEILETLAMHEGEYSPYSREHLREALFSRGYNEYDVKAWREESPLGTEAEIPPYINFRPGGLLSKNLIGFCILLIGACFVDMLFSLGFMGNIPVLGFELLLIFAGAIMFLAFVNIPLIFIQWFYRINKNLSHLGLRYPRYHSAIVIGGFVLPWVNAVYPYFIAKGIIESSVVAGNATSENLKDKAESIARMWWGSFLLMILVTFWLYYLYGEYWLAETSWIRAVYDIAHIISAIFAIQLVRIVDKLQMIKYNTLTKQDYIIY